MIIFGTTSTTSTRQSGQFHCPRCGVPQLYYWKQVNRWFTLYFIPVIPLGRVGDYVECTRCGGTYASEVLSYDPAAERAALFSGIKAVLVLAMTANGRSDRAEIGTLCEAYENITGEPLDETDVWSTIQWAQRTHAQLGPYAAQQGAGLNPQGKAMLIRAAYDVLCTHGGPRADAQNVLAELARALHVPPGQVQRILSES